MEKSPPLTVNKISQQARKAPELSEDYVIAPQNPMEWSSSNVHKGKRRAAPKSAAEWSARLKQIYAEDRITQGNYWEDEETLDMDFNEKQEYLEHRRISAINDLAEIHADETAEAIQSIGYDFNYDYKSKTNQDKNFETDNPKAEHFGNLMFALLTPDVRKILQDNYDAYLAKDPATVNRFKTIADQAMERLIAVGFSDDSSKAIREFLIKEADGTDFALKQLETGVLSANQRLQRMVKVGKYGLLVTGPEKARDKIHNKATRSKEKIKSKKPVQKMGELAHRASTYL